MKYIMMEISNPSSSLKRMIPIIFPNILVHEDVRRMAKIMLETKYAFKANIVSAGTVDLLNGSVDGESKTTGLEHHPDDVNIIFRYDYEHGVGYER